jgi:ribosomal protein S27AE
VDGGRQAECPNCGAPIAWKLASSHGAICAFCRFSVIRSDRELSAIGRVADLVPTAPALSVGDEGTIAGRPFRVLGRLQLDHGRGPWDEWYISQAESAWAWLARAEGRWYLTFEREGAGAPPWETLSPSATLTLPGTGSVRWVVTERGGSALLSAEGELPHPVAPTESGRYVDMEGEGGAFATLDYGDGERVRLFSGRELAPDELAVTRTAVGPRPLEKVAVQRLSCPSCGAPVPLFVPSETERCGCGACGALLDHRGGALSLLAQLDPPDIRPQFALGSEAQLFGARRTLIGFMQRSVTVDGDRYTFREYLLHSDRGYSWLLEENRHWSYVAPIATSAVRVSGRRASYDGRSYRLFAKNRPEVDFVVGEFYWKVARGDLSETADYIAPPRLLSVERTDNEVSWSEGEYVAPEELYRAFGAKERPPVPSGVGAAQPNPFRGRAASYVFLLLALLWFLLAFAYELGARKPVVFEADLALPERESAYMQAAAAASAPREVTLLSPPFQLSRGPTTLQVEVESPISNGSVSVNAALVPESAGEPRELSLVVERYQGSGDDGAWSEGGSDSDGYFSRVRAGRYSLRFVASWAPFDNGWAPQLTPPLLHVRVTRGARSPACCFGTLLLLALPFLFTRMRARVFEQRRNENGNV